MARIGRVFSFRKSAAIVVAASAMAIVVPAGNAASADWLKCSGFVKGNVEGPKSLNACIGVIGNKVYGKGYVKKGSSTDTENVPMVIGIYKGIKPIAKKGGDSISATLQGPGDYTVAFSRSDDQLIIESPIVTIH